MSDLVTRLDKMATAIPKYAKAKAERVYIEHFRKSKKALLMAEATADGCPTSAKAEQYAYARPEYIELLQGLKCAVEIEERHRWSLESLKMEFEMWRTTQANERYLKDKV